MQVKYPELVGLIGLTVREAEHHLDINKIENRNFGTIIDEIRVSIPGGTMTCEYLSSRVNVLLDKDSCINDILSVG